MTIVICPRTSVGLVIVRVCTHHVSWWAVPTLQLQPQLSGKQNIPFIHAICKLSGIPVDFGKGRENKKPRAGMRGAFHTLVIPTGLEPL